MHNFAIQAHGLEKKFFDVHRDITILDKLNFSLLQGQSVAIIGPSGSGKSTLLHILAGLDTPDGGTIHINGANISSLDEQEICKLRNRDCGFVYQQHHLLKDFNVVENIMLPALIHNSNSRQIFAYAKELLSTFGLLSKAKSSIVNLSGGERQRVSILRAIVNSPSVLFADEPTGNLCQASAKKVYKVLLDMQKFAKASLVVVTHDMALAKLMDVTYTLVDGKLESC